MSLSSTGRRALSLLACFLAACLFFAYRAPTRAFAEGEGGASYEDGVASVSLPGEIPFRMVLLPYGGFGLVESDEFFITNNGPYPTEVSMNDLVVTLADPEHFMLLDNPELPYTGCAIYITMDCMQEGKDTASYYLTGEPTTAHTFRLESGESASFRFGGTVSEMDGPMKWADTSIKVSVVFGIKAEVPPEERGWIGEAETQPESLYEDATEGATEPEVILDSGDDETQTEDGSEDVVFEDETQTETEAESDVVFEDETEGDPAASETEDPLEP